MDLAIAYANEALFASLGLIELESCSHLNLDYLEVYKHVALLMHSLAALGALLLDISDVLVPDLEDQLLKHSLKGLRVHGLVDLDLDLSLDEVVEFGLDHEPHLDPDVLGVNVAHQVIICLQILAHQPVC